MKLSLIMLVLPSLILAQNDRQTVVPVPDRESVHVHFFFQGDAKTSYLQIKYPQQTKTILMQGKWTTLEEHGPQEVFGYQVQSLYEDTAIVIEYVTADGDLNMVPIKRFPLHNFDHPDFLFPHLGDSDHWDNTIFLAGDKAFKINGRVGEYHSFSQNVDQSEVASLEITQVQQGDGYAFLEHTASYATYISGFLEFTRIDGIQGSAAVAPVPLIGSESYGSKNLTLCHVAQNQELFWTGYSLFNPNSSAATVQVILYDSNGQILDNKSFNIQGGGQDIHVIGSTRFTETYNSPISWIEFKSTQNLVGLELFGAPNQNNSYLAGFELEGQEKWKTDLLFPAVGYAENRWTGLALVNPQDRDARFDVLLFEVKDGNQDLKVELGPFQLGAKQKWVQTLDDLIAQSPILLDKNKVRAIRVRANQPITGFILVGNEERTQLAGYLGQ